MNIPIKSIAFTGILLCIALIFGCASKTEAEEVPDYSDEKVLERLINSSDREYFLVDVRTPEEYVPAHIPTAINIPVDKIGENPPTKDKDALIIVYCRSGARSARAKATLEEMGYTNVHNFGGIIDWSGETVRKEY